jgi:polyisoprenyl-teichoic acid--peptidoglycan teichoic acid transferase
LRRQRGVTPACHRRTANLTFVHYNIAMGMKVYRAGRRIPDGKRQGRVLRPIFLILLVIIALVLVYLIIPFGGQRVVLLGSDARAGEASRSDTILVTKAGGGMLAVPRDTLVDIPGVGEDKINAAFASGGPELTVETLENLTGVRMNDYVIVHFGGVEEIVDAMGGITLEVDNPIRVGIDGRRVYIPAGTQTLDGTQALAYVRYRGGPTADIGRIGRQQKFLRELARQSTSPAKLPRLPATARATWRNIDTNMNPLEAARFAVRTRLSGIGDTELYPGTPQYIGGISYWVPDKQAGDKVVSETIE